MSDPFATAPTDPPSPRGRRPGTGRRVVALLGVFALGAGAGFGLSSWLGSDGDDDEDDAFAFDPEAVQDLEATAVDECFVLPPLQTPQGGSTYLPVIVVPCSEPHYGEHLADVSLTRLFDSEVPSTSEIEREADAECRRAGGSPPDGFELETVFEGMGSPDTFGARCFAFLTPP
jgi:hypothetical protein